MKSWFSYLKEGFSRTLPVDKIGKEDTRKNALSKVKIIFPFVLKHWKLGILSVIIIVFSNLLSYPQPLINRFMIDNVLLARKLDLLFWVILLMGAIKIIGMITNVLQGFYFTRFEQAVTLDIQHDLFNRVMHFPKSFFDSKETGYLMSRLSSDIGGLRWFFSMTIINILSNVMRFIVGVGLLFYLEWRIATATVLILPVLVIAIKYFSTRVRILSHHSMERQAQISKRLQQSLSSIPLIKSFASEKREIGHMIKEYKESNRLNLEKNAVSSVSGIALNSIGEISRLVVMAAGGMLVISGQWTLGSLMAFQSYRGYVFGPARFFANTNFSFQSALASLERIAAFYDILPEDHGQGEAVSHLNGKIELKNVSFSYNGVEIILENLSFKINPGERVAIVGPSGVGKTTLISLMLAFYKPFKGEILFDDKPVSGYALDSLRKRIGYVSQATRLLTGTIMENLRYGNLEADEEAVISAAKAAGIHDYIVSLPDGYSSLLGENAVNLSEGQRQRLSIARALIKNPDILILDEPTSSLDSMVEKSIFKSLPEIVKNKTLIVIAHRLSTIQDSDRILVLKDKQLIGFDSHQRLIEEIEFYRTLVANQQITTNE
ncbi:MAG: ABC transporter ATP-binding protein [Candidatus Saganbacteria bacterium]|nr:ABC transporter ATP-binding protein [Candidatus Saganbacteria bacterium]